MYSLRAQPRLQTLGGAVSSFVRDRIEPPLARSCDWHRARSRFAINTIIVMVINSGGAEGYVYMFMVAVYLNDISIRARPTSEERVPSVSLLAPSNRTY